MIFSAHSVRLTDTQALHHLQTICIAGINIHDTLCLLLGLQMLTADLV